MTDLKFYSGKKVLITGNTGFKGTWLTVMLLNLGADVVGIASFRKKTNPTFEALNLSSKIKQHKVDIRDAESVKNVIKLEKPQVIFHLAAQALTLRGMREPVLTFQTNVQGTVNLLEAVRATEIFCSVVVVTSDKCYENKEWYWSYRESDRLYGSDPYGASKSMVENAVSAFYRSFFSKLDSIRVCTVRAGNVFGGGDWSVDRLVPDCIRAWSEGTQIEVRSPEATRPWSYVLDVLYGYLITAKAITEQQELNGESFNFGPVSLEVITVTNFVNRIWADFCGHERPAQMKVNSMKPEKVENEQLRLSSEKAIATLGWYPILDLNSAISETVYWYKQYLEDPAKVYDVTEQQVVRYMMKVAEKE